MILLIQLHAATRHITAEILRNAGYRVEEAGDGVEALRLLNVHQFELIIVDVLMPMFAGVDVAASIRRTRPHIPLILTGYMPPVGADAILQQPLGFVFQPVDPPELLLNVRRLLPQSEERTRDRTGSNTAWGSDTRMATGNSPSRKL
jgi:CheY-like chemotaxis protein